MQSGLMLFDAVNFSLLKQKIKDEIFVFLWLVGRENQCLESFGLMGSS
jgi:hypothetical protein